MTPVRRKFWLDTELSILKKYKKIVQDECVPYVCRKMFSSVISHYSFMIMFFCISHFVSYHKCP
jgi:hypothetical protein